MVSINPSNGSNGQYPLNNRRQVAQTAHQQGPSSLQQNSEVDSFVPSTTVETEPAPEPRRKVDDFNIFNWLKKHVFGKKPAGDDMYQFSDQNRGGGNDSGGGVWV